MPNSVAVSAAIVGCIYAQRHILAFCMVMKRGHSVERVTPRIRTHCAHAEAQGQRVFYMHKHTIMRSHGSNTHTTHAQTFHTGYNDARDAVTRLYTHPDAPLTEEDIMHIHLH